MRRNRLDFTTESGLIIAISIALLILPVQWLAAWIITAAFHELGHIFALTAIGAKISGVRIGLQGTIIHTDYLSNGEEILCAIAGPATSILLILLARWLPRVALCAAIQGIYNLLPLYPLDGGRVLHGLINVLSPFPYRKIIIFGIEFFVLSAIGILVVFCVHTLSLGPLPLFLYLILLVKNKKVKFPCKRGREGVQ